LQSLHNHSHVARTNSADADSLDHWRNSPVSFLSAAPSGAAQCARMIRQVVRFGRRPVSRAGAEQIEEIQQLLRYCYWSAETGLDPV
jgi:hypothetical protein